VKRILVTGASGFIGAALVRHLSEAGYGVRAASRSARPAGTPVEHVRMPDLGSRFDWTTLLSGVDAIVHTAAIAHTHGTETAAYDAVNTRAVRELAHAAHGKVERLVFLSSIRAQTGSSAVAPLTETDPPRPTDDYGRSKLAAERALLDLCDAVILRPVLVAGPGARGNLATLLRLTRLPIPLPFSSLSARRSIVARDDVCSAVAHVLNGPEHIGQIYNVAHPNPISVAGILAALREGLGRSPMLFPLPSHVIEKALLAFGMASTAERLFADLLASPDKLMRTGWTARISPHQALSDMAAASLGRRGIAPSGTITTVR
jgi:nucleoside-diphosphate-sugar epimerase